MTLSDERALGCGSVRSDMRALLGTLQWLLLHSVYLQNRSVARWQSCYLCIGLQGCRGIGLPLYFWHRDLHRAVVLPLYWSLECSQRVRLLVTCPTLRKQVDCSGPNTTELFGIGNVGLFDINTCTAELRRDSSWLQLLDIVA